MSLAAVPSFSMLVNGHINSSDILLIFNCSAPSYQKFHCKLSTECDLNIINNVKLRVPNLSSYKTQHKSKFDKQFEKSEKRQDTFKNSRDLD
jgi:hypothetical protein